MASMISAIRTRRQTGSYWVNLVAARRLLQLIERGDERRSTASQAGPDRAVALRCEQEALQPVKGEPRLRGWCSSTRLSPQFQALFRLNNRNCGAGPSSRDSRSYGPRD